MQVIGIEKDKNSLYSALVKKKGGKITIRKLQSHTVDPRSKKKSVKPLYIYRKDEDSPKNSMASGLKARDVLIQNFCLKIRKKNALKKAISFQSEAKSSLEPDQSISIPLIHKWSEQGNPITIFTTSKDRIRAHLKALSRLQLDPSFVTSEAMALVRFAKSIAKNHSNMWILHIGQGSCTCVMMENNFPRMSHWISFGVCELIESILIDKEHFQTKKDVYAFAKKINLLKLDEGIYQNFSHRARDLKNEVAKAFFSFSKEGKKLPLLITGQRHSFLNFSEFLLEGFQEIVSETIENTPKEQEIPKIRKYAIPIGLALDAVSNDSFSLQFRQQEFIPQKHIKKLRLQFAGFFLLCFAMIFLMVFASNHYIEEKTQKIEDHFHQIQTLDHHLLKRDGAELEKSIPSWEHFVRKEAKEFPYFYKAPKVSEVLSWLVHLPSFNSDEIEWKEFRYQLKQYPRISATKDPYLTWVEIEFSCYNPSTVRMFHEALLKEPFLRPKGEIKWDVLNENFYRVSFYLNNPT